MDSKNEQNPESTTLITNLDESSLELLVIDGQRKVSKFFIKELPI